MENHLFSLRLTTGDSDANVVITGLGDGLMGGIKVVGFATIAGRLADVGRMVEVCSAR